MTLSQRLCFLSVPCLCLLSALCAGDTPPAAAAPDPDLPQPLDENTAERLLSSSPFTRILNISDQLILTGVAYIDGKPVATVQDRTTKASYVISDQPNAQGWKLAGAVASTQAKRTEVKILVAGEVATIRYGDQQLAPEMSKKSRNGFDPNSPTYTRDGKTYVRSSIYMTDEQKTQYRALPNEVRDKWREIMQSNTDRLLAAPQEEREAFVKKAFDKFQRQQAAAGGK